MFERARRLFASIALAAATAVAPVASTAQAQIPYLQLPDSQPKYAAVVVDAKTGEVLYAKRADSPRYPASITKVMTLYLAFEALQAGRLKLDDPVEISPRAAAQAPTKLGLRPGETLTVEQAMQALAIKSANDIAVALAEKLGGSEARFAAMMTLRAQELGMRNTRFVNASGLPDSRQISTARDIAILSRAVMRDYPQYYKLFSQQSFTFRGVTMRNHNGLLGRMPGVDGLKTGYTNASGFNIAVSAVRDNRRLITVVLGAPSTAIRNNNAEDLILTGFDVMARRDRGEKITVAQNLFEPEPRGPIVRPSIEQGDNDQDGLKIVLASATPSIAAARTKVEPSSSALRGSSKKDAGKKAAGKWAVQVGAFKSKADAKEQMTFVTKRFGNHFQTARGSVGDKVGGSYRVRFTGYSEASAKDACKAMKAKRLACLVVDPA
ncbi:MAG: D-alanyl-D-alanine carboxypeptidase [Pseudomonadota bacterium]|uniref:D-alanyl-D-alanine carboxypeptidase n=1 Tax=unclassified Phenylobacterium TaxID=2640670 RepID=UPI0007019514|nr:MULTISPECIES: D-alanyl-D-alanine carboxypeptidase [unclassified Phenylobacterium]KRB44736.1 peptidase M15 [Phenylobacterium sp. Root700]MBT9472242.1 D-alanyl-D-alanine carboxypeptidase [Phenylobacterium sp.]